MSTFNTANGIKQFQLCQRLCLYERKNKKQLIIF